MDTKRHCRSRVECARQHLKQDLPCNGSFLCADILKMGLHSQSRHPILITQHSTW